MPTHAPSTRRRRRFVSHDDDLLEEGPYFDVDGVDVNPAVEGFTMIHNYAHYFWRPYLGNTTFALWELLLSFCYGDCDVAYPSIARLARTITNSDHSRAIITGRESTPSSQGEKPHQASTRPGYPGALEALRSEGLVQVMVQGRGPTSRYTFRVLKRLPLLHPDQVALLSPKLQRDHALWLERFGIDEQAFHQAFQDEPSLTPQDTDDHTADSYPHAAPRTTGDAPRTRPRALRRAGRARGGTNNTNQKEPMNNWWQKVMSALRLQLGYHTFEACLQCAELVSFQDGTLTLKPRGQLAYDMIERRLAPLLLDELAWASGNQVQHLRLLKPGETAPSTASPPPVLAPSQPIPGQPPSGEETCVH